MPPRSKPRGKTRGPSFERQNPEPWAKALRKHTKGFTPEQHSQMKRAMFGGHASTPEDVERVAKGIREGKIYVDKFGRITRRQK